MKTLLVALLVVASASALPFLGSVQSVKVTGTLTCNGAPAENVKVKLYEREVVLDTLLDEKTSDRQGRFTMQGSKKEFTTIDPHVNVYHKCNYDGVGRAASEKNEEIFAALLQKLKVKIPKNFVSEGDSPAKTFDIGELNLAGSFSGESTDCLN